LKESKKWSGWRYGETLGFIIFTFIIPFAVILHAKYLVNRHYINEKLWHVLLDC